MTTEYEDRRLAAQLAALDSVAYAEALADCVMDPDPAEQDVFRSPDFAQRSLIAARYLLDHANSTIKRRENEGNRSLVTRTEAFRTRVGMERRLLEAVVAGQRAQNGQLTTPTNPRARAMRVLTQRHPQEFLALVREEQQRDRRRAAVAKAERRAARRTPADR